MKAYIEARVIEEACYIIRTKSTMRETAKKFGVSKSTVMVDMKHHLKYAAPNMIETINKIFDYHKEIRHLRGGEATRMKYRG